MSKEVPEGVEEVLGQLDDLTTKSGKVCISDVLDDFGGRSFGPFIMLPALLELTPVGGIPGVPTFLAALIALVAVQLLIGKEHIWMPGLLQNRAVESKNCTWASPSSAASLTGSTSIATGGLNPWPRAFG